MPRAIVIAIAAAVVAAAAYHALRPTGRDGSIDAGSTVTVSVLYAYSPNQAQLLEPLIARFNAERHLSAGRVVQIDGGSFASGDVEAKVANKMFEPTLWSPASSLWGRLLNYQADARLVADDNPSIVRTPLVIALWRPEAKALGWPRRAIGFRQILTLATSRKGWGAYGLPEFGRFKLGHTNPDFSTSGLSFVAAQYYTATGKREGLTIADVHRRSVRARVRRIEQSIVHYGDTSQFFLDQLASRGPGYLSALAMEEVSLLDYDRTRPQGSTPLVAVYPAEGTFYFDNPLIELHAAWVTPEQRRAAAVFTHWLMSKVTPVLAARYGYRPGDVSRRPASPIDRAHFVDPREPRVVLGLPEPRVLAAIKATWHADRKAANVALVVDTSGSMQDEDKLAQAKRGLELFLRQFSPRDRVGLIAFAQSPVPVVPIRAMAVNRSRLGLAVDRLVANGGTAVYDATAEGVASVQALHDSTRINAVVVLTDGEDNESRLKATKLVAQLQARAEDEEHNVRVFTIAYGSEADRPVLESIAQASGGEAFAGDSTDIADVYQQISSFF